MQQASGGSYGCVVVKYPVEQPVLKDSEKNIREGLERSLAQAQKSLGKRKWSTTWALDVLGVQML